MQSVFLAAVQDYYQVQATSAALDSALESERAAKESFDAAEARYNAGSATPADKLQAQTAYSQATLNRITADGNLKNAQGTLANMLGLDANRGVPLIPANTVAIPDNFEGDIGALIEQARQHRPDLQAAAAQVKAAQAGADAARAAGRPTISLTASSNRYNYSGINSSGSMVGINLSVPLFSGFSTTYRVRSAEAQLEAKNAQLEQVRLQVALDVWTAYQNLTTATQSLRTTRRSAGQRATIGTRCAGPLQGRGRQHTGCAECAKCAGQRAPAAYPIDLQLEYQPRHAGPGHGQPGCRPVANLVGREYPEAR